MYTKIEYIYFQLEYMYTKIEYRELVVCKVILEPLAISFLPLKRVF
ncbi:hypothetical protein SAMN02745171_01062 [Porphyromonas circumdentaria]|uniref:Uncharacterized protein n=1 Tax=Porphyromonas circumdentaria TaxID=29524 RepID=A0A1T4NC44_9PORP|nr:hypothetical protein [Porphyromonas circumdentaria]SJZ76829.1 hypothetical protein SAMN02745171_01062 [Porphyromonas circumdentaria]